MESSTTLKINILLRLIVPNPPFSCYHSKSVIASTQNDVFDLLWWEKTASHWAPINNISGEHRIWSHNMMIPGNWFWACHCPSSYTHFTYSKYVLLLWFRISNLFKIHSKDSIEKMSTIQNSVFIRKSGIRCERCGKMHPSFLSFVPPGQWVRAGYSLCKII